MLAPDGKIYLMQFCYVLRDVVQLSVNANTSPIDLLKFSVAYS